MSELKNVGATPTLKQVAILLGVPMVRLSALAKKPIAGELYDPKAINWDAIKAFIANRLEKTGYDSVEAVLEAAKDVEIAKSSRGHKHETLFGTTPKRSAELNVGDKIINKKTQEEFIVKYVDDTVVVYAPETENAVSLAIGNRVFNARFQLA